MNQYASDTKKEFKRKLVDVSTEAHMSADVIMNGKMLLTILQLPQARYGGTHGLIKSNPFLH